MTDSLNAAKKRVVRRHMLQQAGELYLHPQTDRAIAANLKDHFPAITVEHVREGIAYLEGKGLLKTRKSGNGLSIQVTARGIDVIDGAVSMRGIDPFSAQLGRLEHKRDMRRRVLSYCRSFHEYYNEDTEILAEFRESGFTNVLIEEIRFHVWYLGQKGFLDIKTVSLGGEQVSMARITAKGIDVFENSETDPGVSDDSR